MMREGYFLVRVKLSCWTFRVFGERRKDNKQPLQSCIFEVKSDGKGRERRKLAGERMRRINVGCWEYL